MSDGLAQRVKDFACRILDRRGGIVDWPDEQAEGMAMLPPDVADALRCMEILPLSARADGPLPLTLSSDFLDRTECLLAAEPNVVRLRAPSLYLKQSDLTPLIDRRFSWLNARVRVQETIPARVLYETWYFRAVLDSADRWEELVSVTINGTSGARAPWCNPFGQNASALQPLQPSPGTPPTAQAVRRAARCVLTDVRGRSAAFVSRQEARLDRDRRRLKDYYGALLSEDRRRTKRLTKPPDPEQQKARAKAVQLELRRKFAELEERYAFRLDLAPLAVVQLDCPVLLVHCHVQRKTAARVHEVFWNAVGKELEPMACHKCGQSTFAVAFSDDDVVALCPACH